MALGAVSIGVALAIGALGNIVGSAIAGVDTVWDISGNQIVLLVLANVLNLLIGFMLGVLIRNSPGAIVAFVVYSFVLPTLSMVLGNFQQWWEDLRPWLDFNWAQGELYDGSLTVRAVGPARDLRPDLAGRPPGRRPGDGDAVGGEVAPPRPPGRTTRTPGGHSAGGPRTSVRAASHPADLRPWSDAVARGLGYRRRVLPLRRLALPVLLAAASVAVAGPASADVTGSTSTQDVVLFDHCQQHPISYDLAVSPGTLLWRLEVQVADPQGHVSEGTVVNSATNPATSGTVSVTFCGSEPAGTYTVRGTGFYEVVPALQHPVRAARDLLRGPAAGHPHRARREVAGSRSLPAHHPRP